MKRFSFRLEQVRRWRQDQAGLEEMRLQQLYAELNTILVEQREIAAAADESRRAVLAKSAMSAGELNSLEAYHDYATHNIRRLKQKEEELRVRIGEQRRRVLEAHRRFRLLDGLRNKALAAWTAACDKEQEEVAAELYLAKRGR